MKFKPANLKNVLMLTFSLSGSVLLSQTREQSRVFVSRTHIAIAKIEKEMYYTGQNNFDADVKKAIKYQMIAVKLFKENNFKDAVAYSYKSRVQSMEICSKMNIAEGSTYELNAEEKTFCDPSKYTSMNFNIGLLSSDDSQKVETLDMLNPQKFHELELGNLK